MVPLSSGAATDAATRWMVVFPLRTIAHPADIVVGSPSTRSWRAWVRDDAWAMEANMATCPERFTEPEKGRMESTSTPSTCWAAVMRVSGSAVAGRSTNDCG